MPMNVAPLCCWRRNNQDQTLCHSFVKGTTVECFGQKLHWMRLAWCILLRWAADLAADLVLPLRLGRAQWARQSGQVTLSEWDRGAQWANQSAQVTLSEWDRLAYIMVRWCSVTENNAYIMLRGVLSFTQWAKSGMGWALKRKGKAKTCQTLSCVYAKRSFALGIFRDGTVSPLLWWTDVRIDTLTI